MNKDWVKIYTTGQLHLATLAEQALNNSGIETVQMNKKDSSYLFGRIDIMVEKNNYDKAMEIINQFEKDLDIE